MTLPQVCETAHELSAMAGPRLNYHAALALWRFVVADESAATIWFDYHDDGVRCLVVNGLPNAIEGLDDPDLCVGEWWDKHMGSNRLASFVDLRYLRDRLSTETNVRITPDAN